MMLGYNKQTINKFPRILYIQILFNKKKISRKKNLSPVQSTDGIGNNIYLIFTKFFSLNFVFIIIDDRLVLYFYFDFDISIWLMNVR